MKIFGVGTDIVKKNRIQGIKLNNGTEIQTDNVVCNADPPSVYDNLRTKNSLLFSLKRKRMEYSMGLFVYYFGTKKIYKDIQHHTIKFGNKYKEHLEDSLVPARLASSPLSIEICFLLLPSFLVALVAAMASISANIRAMTFQL